MSLCPCGLPSPFDACCGLFLANKAQPQTPEQLMRSRYTAYTLANIDYIKRTMKGTPLNQFNALAAKQWAEGVAWIGLKITQSYMESPVVGFVEFTATYIEHNQLKEMHELSEFHLDGATWIYVDQLKKNQPPKKQQQKISRNSPCPCGSGKKFKNCHEK